jgi:hypothetical protein
VCARAYARVREEVDKIRERNDVGLACRAYFLKTAAPRYRPTRSQRGLTTRVNGIK